MKIDIELGKVKVRVPETKTDLPVNVIVGDGGGPEPGPSQRAGYTKIIVPMIFGISKTQITASGEVV